MYLATDLEDDDQDRKDALYDALLTAPAPDATAVPDALTQYASAPPPSPTAGLMDKPYAATPSPSADMDAATAYGNELDQRRADAMQAYTQAAAQETGGPSVGSRIGDFLGDNAVGLLGTFIDLAANKGRNIPGILTANAAAAEQSRKARGEAEDRAMDFALKAQGQRAQLARHQDAADRDQAYKQALARHWAQQAAASDANIGIRREGLDIRKNLADIQTNPNNPAIVALKEQLATIPGVDAEGLKHQNLLALRQNPVYKAQVELWEKRMGVPIAVQQAGQSAAASAAGRLGVETSPEMVERQAAAGGAIAEAKGAGSARGKLSVDTIDVDRLAEQNPILTFADKTLAQQAMNKLGYKFTDALSGANRSAHIIQGFYNLKKEFDSLPERVLRGEMTPAQALNRRAALATAWEGHTDELAGVMSKISNASGVAPREDVKHMVPWLENPFADDRIAGLWDSVAENIKGNLGTFGITAAPPQFLGELNQGPAFKGGGHGAPAAKPKAKPAAPAAPAAAPIRVRRKSDGKVITLPAVRAKIYLNDPGFEQLP